MSGWLIRLGYAGGHGSSYYLTGPGAYWVTGSPWRYLTACEHCAHVFPSADGANARADELRASARRPGDTFAGFTIYTVRAWRAEAAEAEREARTEASVSDGNDDVSGL